MGWRMPAIRHRCRSILFLHATGCLDIPKPSLLPMAGKSLAPSDVPQRVYVYFRSSRIPFDRMKTLLG